MVIAFKHLWPPKKPRRRPYKPGRYATYGASYAYFIACRTNGLSEGTWAEWRASQRQYPY